VIGPPRTRCHLLRLNGRRTEDRTEFTSESSETKIGYLVPRRMRAGFGVERTIRDSVRGGWKLQPPSSFRLLHTNTTMRRDGVTRITAAILTFWECGVGAGPQSFVNVRLDGAEKVDEPRPAITKRRTPCHLSQHQQQQLSLWSLFSS
jgi:hypothetical protein